MVSGAGLLYYVMRRTRFVKKDLVWGFFILSPLTVLLTIGVLCVNILGKLWVLLVKVFK